MIPTEYKNKLVIKASSLVPKSGMVALGAGSTINLFIKELSKLNTNVVFISASSSTSLELYKNNLPEINSYVSLKNSIPIMFDGADSIVKQGDKQFILKGIGGAVTNEKILWKASNKVIVLVDSSKYNSLSNSIVVIEILPISVESVKEEILSIYPDSCSITLRTIEPMNMPFISDNGLYNLHIKFNKDNINISGINNSLKSITGVLETGIFSDQLVDKCEILVA